jgi:hypothetical protein
VKRYEYKVIDTGKHVEAQLNELGAEGWRVVGVTTKKQLMIAPPQAVILMRELQPAVAVATPEEVMTPASESLLATSR